MKKKDNIRLLSNVSGGNMEVGNISAEHDVTLSDNSSYNANKNVHIERIDNSIHITTVEDIF